MTGAVESASTPVARRPHLRLPPHAARDGALCAITLGLALLATQLPQVLVLLALAGIIAAMALTGPMVLIVAAIPSTLLLVRLGGSAAGSSVDLSDVLLAAGTIAALPMVEWTRANNLRKVLILAYAYEALLILSIIANPNSHDVVEWVHRLVLIAGSLVVGWVIAAKGRVRGVLTGFLVGASILAVITVLVSAAHGFTPGQFGGGYQKNSIGAVMWIAIAVAHLNPPWVNIRPRTAQTTKYLCIAGLLATQSKQCVGALLAVFLVAAWRHREIFRRSKALTIAIIPGVVIAVVLALGELTTYHTRYNSVSVRSQAYSSALQVWRLDIWFGQGPRWFYLPRFIDNIQPPNIVVEALSESGLVGVFGMVILLGGTIWILRGLPKEIGTLALAISVGRLVESTFDIYWVSAAGSLPWLIAGLALGVADNAASVPVRLRSAARGAGLRKDGGELLGAVDPRRGLLRS